MKNLPYILLLTVLTVAACSSQFKDIFANKTPYEKYEDKVEGSPLGREWKVVAERSLLFPQSVQLPYSHRGYFPNDKPRALSLAFSAKQGEQIKFELNNVAADFRMYADLFRKEQDETEQVAGLDLDSTKFGFDIEQTGSYILRLQPRLDNAGTYTISISTGASLGFPVSGNKARTGSFWGDDRDGGNRSHEGIDIFAPKGTPAIAATDGYISSVKDGGLGGKTVSIRPVNKSISLYYAHLDKQLVTEGQFVKKGDVVGLVGNTGNAKHTPAHLHFGIYSYGGAVDPYPFVNNTIRKIPTAPEKELIGYLLEMKLQKTNTILTPLAISSKGYIAELPDGSIIQTSVSAVKQIKQKDLKPVAQSTLTAPKKS